MDQVKWICKTKQYLVSHVNPAEGTVTEKMEGKIHSHFKFGKSADIEKILSED